MDPDLNFQHYQEQYHYQQDNIGGNPLAAPTPVLLHTAGGVTNTIQPHPQQAFQQNSHLSNKINDKQINDTLLEFDYNLDNIHLINSLNGGVGPVQQQQMPCVCSDCFLENKHPQNVQMSNLPCTSTHMTVPFVCEEVSMIVPQQ